MNKKAIIVVSMILGLAVFVPLVAASPLIQNLNGDTLQTQDQTQLQTRDCDGPCLQDGTQANDCNQTCTQDRQRLQSCDCNNTCNGLADCDETQTRQRLSQQEECGQAGNAEGQQYCYANQQQVQHRNGQAP
ncbi:MAG: hypothetical protein ACQCN3_07540 [Candidatus Bathyarchaeia archaeon]